ncbi:glycosyltransferase [Vibrio alginolyticus]|uniref:glycosyltransferase n=1 Tax=Vibrio alginolyticus TaxID=663 RepID=UPI000CE99F20|nr:glycosyltransferase family A protein [Vibrio alginolyticus]AVF67392.1 hypothetical protein AL541_25435 [Vibrio alginolyticus]
MKLSGSIDIITPFYNGAEFVVPYLYAMNSVVIPEGYNVNLILIDNGSDDNSVELIKTYPNFSNNIHVKLISYTDKKSSYAARNFGVNNSFGEYILFTDIDCIVHENWILNYVNALLREKNTIFSGHVEFFFENKKLIDTLSSVFDSTYFLRNDINAINKTGVTANAAISRVVFNDIGSFDENTSGADHLYFSRAKLKRVDFSFVCDAIVRHPTRNYNQILAKIKRISLGKLESNKKISYFSELAKMLINPMLFATYKAGVFKKISISLWLPYVTYTYIVNFKSRYYLLKYKAKGNKV